LAVTADVAGVLRLYRSALAHCWLPSALLALVWTALSAALSRRVAQTDDLLQWMIQTQLLLSSAYFWQLLAVASAASVLLYCALVADIHAVAVGGAAPALAGLATALRAFPAALLGAVVFLLLTSLATMAFIVPGAYLWGLWQLWLVALVIERTGPVAALSRSRQLVAGHWWRFTALVTVVTIVSIVPPLLFDTLAGPALALLGLDASHALTLLAIADGLLNVLLLPLIPAALVACYVDRVSGQPIDV
jgi:hypothetical protein